MRIDHAPAQALLPLYTSHQTTNSDLAGTENHVTPEDNCRPPQAGCEDSAVTSLEMCPMRIGSIVDGFERKGRAWFVATELQSDLAVGVGDMSFHLHKFPLLSRSGKLNRLVFDSRDSENSHIQLDDMPGGPETFELAAKFCYGVAVELTSANVAALRCAAEYLEMTEDLEEGNLVSKTEAFLSFVVLASWKDSIAVLRNCEKLIEWAEELQIVRRCCESIAWKACTDPRGIRWSFTERTQAKKTGYGNSLWTGPKSLAGSMSDQVPSDWWFEDICVVCVNFFTKIIQAIKAKGMRHDLIGSAIVQYAIQWLPGLTKELVVIGGKDMEDQALVEGSFLSLGPHSPYPPPDRSDDLRASDIAIVQDKKRLLIETLTGILPTQKDSVPCTFLLRLLRLAKMLNMNSTVITDLEKRAGLQLDQGTLSDLLIPSFDQACRTLFDVDLVQRMLDYFLLQNFIALPGTFSPLESDREKFVINPTVDKIQTPHSSCAAKMRVAKLIDNYLAEVGRDPNLSLQKFLALAEALPEHTRVTDDGLYKAIDTYLKAHPILSEHERKRLCRTLDCQRLSLDACMHAAQNERLPLRVVVQVLFGEQIKLRNAVTGTSSLSKEHSGPYPVEDDQSSIDGSSHDSVVLEHDPEHDPEHSEEEIRVLRSDVERMKGKFMALQHDYSAIQQQLEKLTKHPKVHAPASGWKKLFPGAHIRHPHFHVPHFLALFHQKDHHHDRHRDQYFKEHDSHHHGHLQKGHDRHVLKEHDFHLQLKKYDFPHGGYSKDYNSQRHHSREHDLQHEHLKEHGCNAHLSKDPECRVSKDDQLQSKGYGSLHLNEPQYNHQLKAYSKSHHHLSPRDSLLVSHSKHSDHLSVHTHHLRDEDGHEELYDSRAGHSTHPYEADPPQSKDHHFDGIVKGDEFQLPASHHDVGEDSSRSLEGPITPTLSGEHVKKHARPFASAIRKWRNSIS